MKTRDITGTPVEHPDKMVGRCTCDHLRGTGRTTRLWEECVSFAVANPDKKVTWVGPFLPAPTRTPPNVRWVRRGAGSRVDRCDPILLGIDPSCVFKDHTV